MNIFSKCYFTCVVMLKIIKTTAYGIYFMVLKICEEIELALKGDAKTTFSRTEVRPFNYSGLESTRLQVSDLVDQTIRSPKLGFVISDFSIGKTITVKRINRDRVVVKDSDISHGSTNNIRKRLVVIEEQTTQICLKFDNSAPLAVPVSSPSYTPPRISKYRNIGEKGFPVNTQIFQNENHTSSSKIVKSSTERPVIEINSFDQNCKSKFNEEDIDKKKFSKSVNETQCILKQRKRTSSLDATGPDGRNVIPKEKRPSSCENNYFKGNHFNLQLAKENPCQYGCKANDHQWCKSKEKLQKMDICKQTGQHDGKTNIGSKLSSSKEDCTFVSRVDDTSLKVKDYFAIPTFKDGEVYLDTKEVSNVKRCTVNFGTDLTECDTLHTKIKDSLVNGDVLKDETPNFRENWELEEVDKNLKGGQETNLSLFTNNSSNLKTNLNSIEKDNSSPKRCPDSEDDKIHTDTKRRSVVESHTFNCSSSMGGCLQKDDEDIQYPKNSTKDAEAAVDNFTKSEHIEEGNDIGNSDHEQVNSSLFSTQVDIPHQGALSDIKATGEDLETGIVAYLNYLREIYPILKEIESQLLNLGKTHLGKSHIYDQEVDEITSKLIKVFVRSKAVNTPVYHLVVTEYIDEMSSIAKDVQNDVAMSVILPTHMKVSLFAKRLTIKIVEARIILFSVHKDAVELEMLLATPITLSKKKRGRRRK